MSKSHDARRHQRETVVGYIYMSDTAPHPLLARRDATSVSHANPDYTLLKC